MLDRSILSLLFLLSSLTSYAADLHYVELGLLGEENKKSNEPALDQKLSTYRSYKARNLLVFKGHEACVSINKHRARTCLQESLEDLDQEGVLFYAPYAEDISDIFYTAIFKGNVEQSKIALRALKKTESYSLDGNPKYELPCADPTGLAACVECNDEGKGLEIARDILDYYTPKRAGCDASCWGACNSKCQELRKVFLAFGLSKALEKSVKLKRSERVIDFFLEENDAFVTQQALHAAAANADSLLLLQPLNERRGVQMVSNIANNYTLLRDYKCLSEKPLEGQHGKDLYRYTVVEPVLRAVIFNKKPGYASWNPCRALCAKE